MSPAAIPADDAGKVVKVLGQDVVMVNNRPKNLTDKVVMILVTALMRAGDIGKRFGEALGMGRQNANAKRLAKYMTEESDQNFIGLVDTWDLKYQQKSGGKTSDDHTKRLQRQYEAIRGQAARRVRQGDSRAGRSRRHPESPDRNRQRAGHPGRARRPIRHRRRLHQRPDYQVRIRQSRSDLVMFTPYRPRL